VKARKIKSYRQQNFNYFFYISETHSNSRFFFYFHIFFCVYFLFYYYFFFGVSDIEEKYEKRSEHTLSFFMYISLHSTSESALDAPVNTTIQYGHKRERSEKKYKNSQIFYYYFSTPIYFILYFFCYTMEYFFPLCTT
jgi:hypothetical protein